MKRIYSLGVQGGLFGAIDCTGNWLVPPIFNALTQFDKGYASARLNYESCIVDCHGNIEHLRKFEEIEPPCDKFAVFWTGNAYGILNLMTKQTFCTNYESIENLGHGLFAVEDRNHWGIIDSFGKTIIPMMLESYPDIYFRQGLIISKLMGSYVAMDFNSKVVRKYNFDEMGRFCRRGAIVRLGSAFGVVGDNGEIRMPFHNRRILKCCDVERDLWLIEQDNVYAIYDLSKQTRLRPDCEDMIGCEDGEHSWLLLNGSWSLYDLNFNCIVHNYCEELGPFVNKYYIATRCNSDSWLVRLTSKGLDEVFPSDRNASCRGNMRKG